MDAVKKRIHKLCPTMKRAKMWPRKEHPVAHLLDRLKTAKRRVRLSIIKQLGYVFIDAKSMPMQIDRESRSTTYRHAEVQRAAMKNSRVPKLNYYIAVGGYAGALNLYYYTGTTGMKVIIGPITFEVS